MVGNRCHLAYKREVSEADAEAYALKSDMAFFEVSPLCDFNVMESMAELSRVALKRNGMNRTWGPNKGNLVQDTVTLCLCYRVYCVQYNICDTLLVCIVSQYATKPMTHDVAITLRML